MRVTTTRAQVIAERLKKLDASFVDSNLLLDDATLGTPAGWFLGPKAENKDILLALVAETIEQHCQYRTSYHSEDPIMITDAVKASAEYKQAIEALRSGTAELNTRLRHSAPIFSMRSHGHMLWDQVLPGTIGYFAGMLFNQNNVAAEASPVTTWLEILVGNDLCGMLGYAVPADGNRTTAGAASNAVAPWGHITCDGSVANIEAMWAARNARFYGIAIRAALQEVPLLAPARQTEVQLLDGTRARLIDLDTWTLLNLTIDETVALPQRIADALAGGPGKGTVRELGQVAQAFGPFTLPHVGIVDFYQRFMAGFPQAPVVLVPSTSHYSWPKAGTLLGLGQNNIQKVHVDLRARMHIPDLVDKLRFCLLKRVPVLSVVAVIGTTEESAVDPLDEILEVREQFRRQGLDFAVHADAAWGGYFASMYREPGGAKLAFAARPEYPMSAYVGRQYAALARADSITVDPHKAGFVPYPAGGLCYRNSGMRDLVSLKAPVVFHSQSEPTVGVYGIEGSKPGAAAAAVYLAHRVIRPNKQGYGKILGECVWTSKRMYCRLLTMQDRYPLQPSPFRIALLQMLPAERDGLGADAIKRQRDMVASFVAMSNAELRARLRTDREAAALFDEIGSDQVILTYAFNFRDPATGTWNTDPGKCNVLNDAIYKICSIVESNGDPNEVDLILTGSAFDVDGYGSDFVEHFGRRLGVENPNGAALSFLISTTMNPWTTDTPAGDFLAVVEGALHAAVTKAAQNPDLPAGILTRGPAQDASP